MESTIFCWITSLIYPFLADKIAQYRPFEKDNSEGVLGVAAFRL
jgi:hypothetical protein